VRWTWEGTHRAPIRGYPASGARVKDSGMAIYEFAGGKIRSVWLQTDRLGFLQQIGVVPDDATLRAGVASR
jgi:predicted ester cyclase